MTGREKLLAGVALLYPLLIVAVIFWLDTLPHRVRLDIPAGLLGPLIILLAVVGLINIATPWQNQGRWLAGSQRLATGDRTRALLLGVPQMAAPASYGLLLYLAGASPAVAALFAAASLAAGAAWGLRGPAARR